MGILSNQRKIWTDLSYVVSNVITNLRESKLSVVIIIYCSFLVDNILLTMVVPIIPDYLERINIKSDKTLYNNLSIELNGKMRQLTSTATTTEETSTSFSSSSSASSSTTSSASSSSFFSSSSSSTSSPPSSSLSPLFSPIPTSLSSPSPSSSSSSSSSFLSPPTPIPSSASSSLNGNIFTQWNQSKESAGSFGEKTKISYKRWLLGGKKEEVVKHGKKDYQNDKDDDDDDDGDGGKEIGNEEGKEEDGKESYRLIVKANKSLLVNTLMEGQTGHNDWTVNEDEKSKEKKRLKKDSPENEPIDWKSMPIRRSKIVQLMLKDSITTTNTTTTSISISNSNGNGNSRSFGHPEKYKEKDSTIGYGKHDDDDDNHDSHSAHHHHYPFHSDHQHRHFHNHFLRHHHRHSHHSADDSEKTNFPGSNQGVSDDDDNNQEERLVGTLFASKAVFQLLFNPVSMKLIQSYGHNFTQIMALMVLLVSALIYAFSNGIKTMFLARCIHGIGSSIISISGMATIANLFQDEKTRCQIMGISLGGIAAGVLIGYPFGGFAYDFCGKQLPFLLIAFLFSLIIGFQITFMPMEEEIDLKMENFHLVSMVKDLDIMIAIGSIFFTTSITAVLEPILPIYLMDSLNAPEWQLGIAFLPDSCGYIIGAHILGFDKYLIDKWVITIISLFLAGFATILIPLTTHFYQLIIPQFLSGLSIGVTDAAMSTQLASIVDDRYSANYSMVYTFSQVSVCLAYIIGPILSGALLPLIGTTGALHVLGIVVILYGIICISYRLYLAEIIGGRHWTTTLSEVLPILSWNSYETLGHNDP